MKELTRVALLLLLAAIFSLPACKSTPPTAENHTGHEADEEEPAEFPVAPMPGHEANDEEPAHEACLPPREFDGMCAQVITWAKDPETGTCCQYPNPCVAPEDWETFHSKDECQAAQ